VISNSAQVGIASGFLGAIGVFAKGAPVRIIGGSYTGGAQDCACAILDGIFPL